MGYKNELYFWEFVIMFRKMLTLSVTLMPETIKFCKGALVLFITTFSLLLHMEKKPFYDLRLNNVEYKAILVSTITIFVGLFYLEDVDENLKILFFSIILIVNLSFLVEWIKLVLILAARKYRGNKILNKYLVKAEIILNYLSSKFFIYNFFILF